MLTESAFQIVGEGDGKRLGILNTSCSARWHDSSGRCSGRRRGTRAVDQGPPGGYEGDHQGDPQVHDCVRTVHLKRAFQGLVDRGGEAEPIGRWGLAEIERLFALWHVRPGREMPAQASDRHKGRSRSTTTEVNAHQRA